MQAELKPCPNPSCGETLYLSVRKVHGFEPPHEYVECGICGMHGPEGTDPVADWNALPRIPTPADCAKWEALREELAGCNQTSAEVCDECGWAMKFPDEPCRNCEVDRLARAMREIGLVAIQPAGTLGQADTLLRAIEQIVVAALAALAPKEESNG